MSGLEWVATAPLRAGARVARSLRADLPILPRPTISVGNLAFGGRAKTPVVAALARAARADGLRPAILTRGYGGRVRRSDSPVVVVQDAQRAPVAPAAGRGRGVVSPLAHRARPAADPAPAGRDRVVPPNPPRVGHGLPPWRAPVAARAAEIGDEPAWLAAVCPGVPVGVHPRRDRAAAAVLDRHDVDLFLLDDGFQTAIARDADVVLLDPRRDPPFVARAATRESAAALARATVVGLLAPADPAPLRASTDAPVIHLRRRPAGLRPLAGTGDRDLPPVRSTPTARRPVTVIAGVGDPGSVAALAAEAGCDVRAVIAPGDHRAPGALARAKAARAGHDVVVTEKDAVGWAAAAPPSERTWVLGLAIEGTAGLWTLLSGSGWSA